MYYTKYRPQKFSEISQPNDTALALMNQLKSGKTGHAYLFVGPRGTGKTTTARILAKALNCTKLDNDGNPCLKCEACLAINHGNFIDLIEIDAASNRGIDDIRELREKIKLAPSSSLVKVYIIDEVHMLTTEAFNALLKTLEEPPKHVVFILCTTEIHKVPDTIKSRCQVFKFKRATKAQLIKKLEKICKEEEVKHLKKKDLEKIADASFGGFRDAETLLQQVVEGSLDIDSFVGLASQQIYMDFVGYLIERKTDLALKAIQKVYAEGLDMHVWVLGLLSYLRDLMFVKTGTDESILDVSDEVLEEMKVQAQNTSFKDLIFFLEEFLESGNKINSSIIPPLPLEVCVVKICENAGSDIKIDIGVAPLNTQPVKTKAIPSKDIDDYGEDFLEDTDDDDDNEDEESIVVLESHPVIEFSEIEGKWKKIVKEIVQVNTSVYTLLRSAVPVGVDGNVLNIEVLYKFHKERLEIPKNRKIVENVLETSLGVKMNLNCVVNQEKRLKKKKTGKETGELTDQNISAPVFSTDIPDNITDIFDGALPL